MVKAIGARAAQGQSSSLSRQLQITYTSSGGVIFSKRDVGFPSLRRGTALGYRSIEVSSRSGPRRYFSSEAQIDNSQRFLRSTAYSTNAVSTNSKVITLQV